MSVPDQQTPSFGRYKDASLLGSGGMGAVYKATDPSLDRFVAIKVLTHREPKYVERFRREAQVLAKIMHPSIIQIYEIVGSDEDGFDPYIVMEYFDGKPLDSLLKMGPLPPAQVVSILRQTADGLSKAHRNNVIHRDIKPANIMMAASGEVKILDFGIAKALDAKKDLTGQTVLGTPYYMSPEQAMGHPIDARTDIYSLGITAFHLLTGRRPFEAKSKVDVMLMQVKNPLPKLTDYIPDLDPRIVALIEKMCAKQPQVRHQNTAELIDALDELPKSLGGKAPDDRPSGSRAKPPPPPPPTGAEAPLGPDVEVPRPEPRRAPVRPPPPASAAPAPTAVRAPQKAPQTPSRTAAPPVPHRASAPIHQVTPNATTPRAATPPAQHVQQAPSRPALKAAPPPKSRLGLWIGLGAVAGVLVVAGVIFALRGGSSSKTGPWRVPAKGWTNPGPPAPATKKVQSAGGYGNCIFSTKAIERGGEEQGALRTVFAGSESIFARCYFAHEVGPNKAGEVWQEIWIDGQKRAQVIYDPPLPNDEDQLGIEVSRQHASRIAELSPGKHIIDLWIYRQHEDSENPEPLAAGEFTLRK